MTFGEAKKYFNRHLVQYREWENAIGEHIVRTLQPASMIDLGCGVGSYLEGCLRAQCTDVLGIEIAFDVAKLYFVKEVEPYIRYGDVTADLNLNRTFNCVMSFEVAEHIDGQRTNNFIKNLTELTNDHIILTAAPPGQIGRGHNNLRPKAFWINEITSMGFEYKEDVVNIFVSAWKEFNAPYYILTNLMVFKKI